MSSALTVRNRTRAGALDIPLLRRIALALLRELLDRQDFELGLYVVDAKEMTQLNQTHLRHRGPTDVITFDYGDPAQPRRLAGEIFVCLDEAVRQAARYHVTWQSEIARYLVHGVLHLAGYDDAAAASRRHMKKREDLLVRALGRRFRLRQLGGHVSH